MLAAAEATGCTGLLVGAGLGNKATMLLRLAHDGRRPLDTKPGGRAPAALGTGAGVGEGEGDGLGERVLRKGLEAGLGDATSTGEGEGLGDLPLGVALAGVVGAAVLRSCSRRR